MGNDTLTTEQIQEMAISRYASSLKELFKKSPEEIVESLSSLDDITAEAIDIFEFYAGRKNRDLSWAETYDVENDHSLERVDNHFLSKFNNADVEKYRAIASIILSSNTFSGDTKSSTK